MDCCSCIVDGCFTSTLRLSLQSELAFPWLPCTRHTCSVSVHQVNAQTTQELAADGVYAAAVCMCLLCCKSSMHCSRGAGPRLRLVSQCLGDCTGMGQDSTLADAGAGKRMFMLPSCPYTRLRTVSATGGRGQAYIHVPCRLGC